MSRQAITNYFPNTNITALQTLEWNTLLERIGEDAMYHLLLNTSIFVALPNECFCQLVGTPITGLVPLSKDHVVTGTKADGVEPASAVESEERPRKRSKVNNDMGAANTANVPLLANTTRRRKETRTAADILFSRVRIFYGRPVFVGTEHTSMAVGLPLTHVLNRLAPVKLLADGGAPSEANVIGRDTRHVLKHIFPRQFGLRNPFELRSGEKYNAKDFGDNVVEHEIQAKGNVKTPKRLKPVLQLVEKLIKRHWECNYRRIMSMTCPSKLKKMKPDSTPLDRSIILQMMSEETFLSSDISQAPLNNTSGDSHFSSENARARPSATKSARAKPKFAEFICNHNEVFRFVMKTTSVVVPKAFWGCSKNFKAVMKHVEHFVQSRRHETSSLHSVLQNFSTQECDWLLPTNPVARNQRPSVTDSLKRRELAEDFLYWYFEGFVIPLLKTTFYITESGAFRYRVLYFRQDDWAALCRPLLNRLTEETYEELNGGKAREILQNRKLGYSFVRLLPKETGVRPIVNLRRKSSLRQSDGSPALSINQILQAAFQILTYEKNSRPHLLGASVFGPNETYAKLKNFKLRLLESHGSMPRLFFVKVDVRTCFDSIEQGKLLQILYQILSEDGYMIQKHSRMVPDGEKIIRSFRKEALPESDHPHFLTYAAKLAGMLRNAIFVDQVVYPYEDKEDVLQLLKEHVTENIVKIGAHFYRQTVGIPQGSVLSTILCSFFYGDMESTRFKFTEDAQSVLCRLIDDYLFVTAEEKKARMFLDMMETGHPEYGCFISRDKTLTNFYTGANKTDLDQKEFPWCGYKIDMDDLSISRDYSSYANTHVGDTINASGGRRPGEVLVNKMLLLIKRKTHVIYTDTTLNTLRVVYRNVYQSFLLAGMKLHCYTRSWKFNLHNHGTKKFVLGVIQKTIRYMYAMMRNKASGPLGRTHGAECNAKETVVKWLGLEAFRAVLERKAGGSGYGQVVKALAFELGSSRFAAIKERWSGVVNESRRMVKQIGY